MTMFEFDEANRQRASYSPLLARFLPGVAPTKVEPLGNGGGFSGAAIIRIGTEFGDFALRRWPKPGMPRERICGLHRLLAFLHKHGLSVVAVPLPSVEGTTLVQFDGHDWQLEPWMPGTADYQSSPSRDKLRAAMTSLASWHLTAERFVPDASQAPWFFSGEGLASPASQERLQRLESIRPDAYGEIRAAITGLPHQMVRDVMQQLLNLVPLLRNRIRDELASSLRLRIRLHPCLRDVWHDHLLFVGADVSGLIDPSACRSENVASDLARLIGSLVGDDRIEWDFALTSYQNLRPLSASELTLIEVLDHSGLLLSGWTWLEWICLERRVFVDWDAVLKRTGAILRRLQNLADQS